MKVRYVIEHLPEPGRVNFFEVDADGEYTPGQSGSGGYGYATVEECKAAAEKSTPGLKWKPAPKAWRPDTILVSQFWDDEGWDNR